MSGPVRPPLEVDLSDSSSEVRPCNKLSFDVADFVINVSGTTATVRSVGSGSATIGGSISSTQIAFGATTADSIEGTADFLFIKDAGSGPELKLQGDNPLFSMNDDSGGFEWKTKFEQAGANWNIKGFQDDASEVVFFQASKSNAISTFNPDSGTLDFSVLGNNDTILYADGGQDNVGIGGAPPATTERLHVAGTGTGDMVVIESTAAGHATNDGPDLILYRSASGDDGDELGKLVFRGQDDVAAAVDYAYLVGEIREKDAGSEYGRIKCLSMIGGSQRENWRVQGSEMIVNFGQANMDFDFRSQGLSPLVRFDATGDNVGIGAAPDSGVERLHVKGDGQTAPMVLIESEDDPGITGANPTLRLYNSSTPGINLQGGKLEFSAKNDAGAEFVYGSVGMTIRDSSANEDGSIEIRCAMAGAESTTEYLRIGTSNQAIYLNPGATNIDTQICSENITAMLKVDAGNDNIGIGAAPTSGEAQFQVDEDATFNTYVIPKNEATSLLTGAEVKNTLITVDYNTGASTPTISSGTTGECVTILNLNATQTVTVTAGIGITFASTPAVLNQWESEKWVCYKSNNWVRVANES